MARPPHEGGDAEERHAAEEEAAAPDEVRDAPEEQGEAGGGEGEGGGDPLEAAEREAQALADDGQGDVQDREVHGQHELGQEEDDEDEPHPAGHAGVEVVHGLGEIQGNHAYDPLMGDWFR